MTDIIIDLVDTTADRRNNYGVTHTGAVRHALSGANVHNRSFPHRIQVWDNTGRANPRNGERIRYGECGPIDGGDGRYLDPGNNATDEPTTILLTSESIGIYAQYTAQDIADRREGPALTVGDVVRLRYPDGTVTGEYEITSRVARDPWLRPLDSTV